MAGQKQHHPKQSVPAVGKTLSAVSRVADTVEKVAAGESAIPASSTATVTQPPEEPKPAQQNLTKPRPPRPHRAALLWPCRTAASPSTKYIKQATPTGQQQLILMVSSQQHFYFSPGANPTQAQMEGAVETAAQGPPEDSAGQPARNRGTTKAAANAGFDGAHATTAAPGEVRAAAAYPVQGPEAAAGGGPAQQSSSGATPAADVRPPSNGTRLARNLLLELKATNTACVPVIAPRKDVLARKRENCATLAAIKTKLAEFCF